MATLSRVYSAAGTWIDTVSSFDLYGRATSVTVPYPMGATPAGSTSTVYNMMGNVNPLAPGFPASVNVTDLTGRVTKSAIDARWRAPSTVTDTANYVSVLQYDPFGRLARVYRPDDVGAGQASMYFEYYEP